MARSLDEFELAIFLDAVMSDFDSLTTIISIFWLTGTLAIIWSLSQLKTSTLEDVALPFLDSTDWIPFLHVQNFSMRVSEIKMLNKI